MDEYIGIIKLFAGNFAPQGWMFCMGQTLNITQNQALFSIIGVTYGGNGVTTFNLPDLRSAVPIGFGQAPGFDLVQLSQKGILSTHGSGRMQTVGMNYIICVEGIYPPRS